jgi:phosphate uptake regulator
MEIRKVQQTGGSSYVVTLPKEWIMAFDIKKNDPVGIIQQPDGSLLVTSNITGKKTYATKEFHVDGLEDPIYLFRSLIGAYICGYSMIKIKSKKKIAPFVRDGVIKFTHSAIGPEIIEEDIESITIKDLLDPTEMPLENTLKRMYILVRTMMEDTITSLKNRDASLARDIISRDEDVDRLYWLIARQTNMILKDANLSKKMDVDPGTTTFFLLMSRIIERIGDHAVRMADNVPHLLDSDVDDKIIQTICTASRKSLEIFDSSVNAWLKKDPKASNSNIESIGSLVTKCDQINSYASKVKGPLSLPLSHTAESIKRTGEYSGDISEVVINHLMME